MGTHHPIAMKMKICLLIGCLGPSFIFCIFLSDQQEKSLFSDSADPSIFVAKWRSHLFYFIYYCFNFSAGSSEIVDQDSLDGQLPSSARSIVHDNPSGITPSPTGGHVPDAPAPPPMNFTKGPGAMKKRHRKLNPETEDTMSDDEPSPPPPPSKSVSPRDLGSKESGSGSSKAKNSVANSSTTKAGSAIHLNPFSGVLWERREPL